MRPFPNDPQWLQLSRKIPPDSVVLALLKFGFRPSDIAARFDATPAAVSRAMERLGLDPIPNGPDRHRRNMAMPACKWAEENAAYWRQQRAP